MYPFHFSAGKRIISMYGRYPPSLEFRFKLAYNIKTNEEDFWETPVSGQQMRRRKQIGNAWHDFAGRCGLAKISTGECF